MGSKITLVIPSDFIGSFVYFCTAHSSMQKNILVGDLNNAPTNIGSTALTITENQAVGSMVGEFNATDSDAGATLTYYFANGVGMETILYLYWMRTVSKDGCGFDYETNASTKQSSGSQDEYNASVEGNFTVTLTDLNEAPTSLPMEEDQPLVFYWRRIKLASLRDGK